MSATCIVMRMPVFFKADCCSTKRQLGNCWLDACLAASVRTPGRLHVCTNWFGSKDGRVTKRPSATPLHSLPPMPAQGMAL